MNPKIQAAINAQINVELSAAYSYLAMAAYLEAEGYNGAASWMKQQSKEEIEHAMKFYTFVNERNGRVILEEIVAPKIEFSSILDVFEQSLAQEKNVTKLIYNLYDLSLQEKDYAFESFLKWFLDEQVEEENSVSTVIEKIKLIGGAGSSLYLLDQELGERKEES